MVYQAGGRAFTLCARNAYGLGVELVEEQVGLRGDLHAFRVEVLQGDARCFDDDVVVVHRFKILITKVFNAIHLVLVGYCDLSVGQVFLQETQGGLSLATEAEDKDAFVA